MGLLDKLFGKKKSSEPKSQQEEDRADQPKETIADQADVESEEPPRTTAVASEPEPTPEPESTPTGSQDTEASASAGNAEATAPSPEKSPTGEPEQSGSEAESQPAEEPEQEAAPEPANTIECTGCGRQLPIPLPGHPAKITCPFCATENEYRP